MNLFKKIMETPFAKAKALIFALVVFCNTAFFAAHEKGSSRLNLSQYNSSTNNALYLQDDKYATISSNLATPSAFGFFDHTYKNKLIFGIDRTVTSLGAITSNLTNNIFRAEIDVKVSYNKLVTSGSGFILSGFTVVKTLTVSFSGYDAHTYGSAPTTEVDIDAFNFEKGYQTLVNITAVRIYNTTSPTTPIANTNVPANLFLELQYDAERYHTLNTSAALPYAANSDVTLTYFTGATSGNEIEVKWSRIPGADEYDLEWLWLDEFTYGNGVAPTLLNPYWGAAPELNFRTNSTRIRTDQNTYRISNVYESGHLFVRVRGVGRTKTPATLIALGNPILSECFTNWTWPDLTTIPTVTNNFTPGLYGFSTITVPYFIDLRNIAHEQKKNWVYTGTFAEEGKKQEVLSYFDGSQHSRQTVTKNNSDNIAVVAETYYDYIGRPTIQALPTPVNDATLKFYQQTLGTQTAFNFDNTGTPKAFTKELFAASSVLNTCVVDAGGFSKLYGTGKYYSPNNPFQSTNYNMGYTPNSEKSTPNGETFPYSQTEYVSDMTGKTARQGGVGEAFKVTGGAIKHDTRYLYGSVTQEELDRLFGSEAGYAKYYTKNVVVDPNGQVSISYLNQEGKVVATALSGTKPANLYPLLGVNGSTDLSTTSTSMQIDLLNKLNANDPDKPTDNNQLQGDSLYFNEKIIVTSPQTYSLSYTALGSCYQACGYSGENSLEVQPPPVLCYDCVYDLTIDIKDKCGIRPAGFTAVTYTLGKIIGTYPSQTNPSPNLDGTGGNDAVNFSFSQITPSGNSGWLTVNFTDIGEYTITKKLGVNKAALDWYLNDYLIKCPKTAAQFDLEEASNLNISGCELDCKECVQKLGGQTSFTNSMISANPGTSQAEADAQYYELVKECNEPCQYDSYCEVTKGSMLTDMSPSGQYAEYNGGGPSFDATSFPVSIFNANNSLPRGGSAVPSWTLPVHYKTGALDYLDENGQPDKVSVVMISAGVYNPPLQPSAPVTLVSGNQYLASPKYLANASDFVANFKPSWAQSLLKYHPEYCYIEWCLKNSIPLPSTNITLYTTTYNASNVAIGSTPVTFPASSDNFDSLYMAIDDIDDIDNVYTTTSYNIIFNPLANDPYWDATNGNGRIYVAGNSGNPSSVILPNPAQNIATSASILQLQSTTSASPPDFASQPANAMYFTEKMKKTANNRFYDYKGTSISLYQFAALMATPLALQYGQGSATNLIGMLSALNSYYLSPPLTNSDYILGIIKPGSPGDDSYKRKAWDNFRTLYLALKKELQDEAAQSYVMNGPCRGCNDCIGKANFDENSVRFTTYGNLASLYLLPTSTPPPFYFSNFASLNILSLKSWFNYYDNFITPNNKDQSCGLNTKDLFKNKIKRYYKIDDVVDNSGSGGNTQATIFAQTGLCPNAYDLQGFLNGMFSGAKTIYTVTANDLNLNVPPFTQNLYQSICPVISTTSFQHAMYTFNSGTSAGNTLNAQIQITGSPVCNLTLVFPTSAAAQNQWSNYSGSTPTYTIGQLGGLTPTSSTGFNVQASISTGPIGNITTFTMMLGGNTSCVQLTGCSFPPPCKANGTGKAVNALLNNFMTNQSFPAQANSTSTGYISNIPLLTPAITPYSYVFTNSFKPLLETPGNGNTNWRWNYNSIAKEIVIDDNGTLNKRLKITFTFPTGYNEACIQSLQNFSGDPTSVNPGDFVATAVISNLLPITGCPSGTTQIKGNVSLGTYNGTTWIYSPLKVGECSFDLTTCNTPEHETKNDVEKWVTTTNSGFVPMVTSASAVNISNNTYFTSLLRSYLNSAASNNTSTGPVQNYYWWLPDASYASNPDEKRGWFIVNQSATAPSSAPIGSCLMIAKKVITGGTPISTVLAGAVAPAITLFGPVNSNNIYNFKAAFLNPVDSISFTTACFPLRACIKCTGTQPPPAATSIIIEDFTSTSPNYVLTNSDFTFNYIPWTSFCLTGCGDPCQTSNSWSIPDRSYYHNPSNPIYWTNPSLNPNVNTPAYRKYCSPASVGGTPANVCNVPALSYLAWQGNLISLTATDKALLFTAGPQNNLTQAHKTTFTKSFQVGVTGNYMINYPNIYSQNEVLNYYFNNTLVFTGPANYDPNVDVNYPPYPLTPVPWCHNYNFYNQPVYQHPVNLIAGQTYQIKIEFNHTLGRSRSFSYMKEITANLITAAVPCVNSPWPTDTMPTTSYDEPCAPYLQDLIDNTADEKYDAFIDSMKTVFVRKYIKHCMSSAIENLTMKYNNSDYHYTLYYYDQGGNLSRTVPPQGVVPINLTAIYSGAQTNGAAIKDDRTNYYTVTKKVYTQHKFLTTYTYNSLNQLMKQETPDAGISKFYYDNLGRMVASQNAEQKFQSLSLASNNQKYSFTSYDALGRVYRVGQMGTSDLDAFPSIPVGQTIKDLLSAWNYPSNIATNADQMTRTFYGDDPFYTPLIAGSNFSSGSQNNLRGRVASISIENVDDGNDATFDHATHYSYDIHGNVKELLQDNPEMGRFSNQRFKRIQYTYDLISGKVNTVVYQRNQRDMYTHTYLYDANNRITNVYTSRDSLLWNQDAKYYYYLHGPLARTETGEHKVISQDYAYTLQGWIKGVNNEGLKADYDMGKDGYSTLTGASNSYNLNRFNARDAFGYSLNYYDVSGSYNDYKPINGFNSTPTTYFLAASTLGATSLFNGNIMGMSASYLSPSPTGIAVPDITATTISKYNPYCFQRRFAYDQLNRIRTAEVVGRNVNASNAWVNASTTTTKFYETFKYDQNGNITTLSRKSNGGNMDDLTYYYYDAAGTAYNPQTTTPSNPPTNRLAYVTDANGASTIGDIGSQSSGNYTYDKIGNLKTDAAEGISGISWSIYGKLTGVTKSAAGAISMSYKYDASGNRISKLSSDPTMQIYIANYYVRDAQGNVMATYEQYSNTSFSHGGSVTTETLRLKELDVYGSSRLGLQTASDQLGSIVNNVNQAFTLLPLDNKRTLGTKNYELSNHLGNVIAVISDRKLPVSTGGNFSSPAAYFVPDMLTATDYYAFGSQMPGRIYNGGNYRYGFNGKENDNDVKGNGNSLDFEARIYDSRLGRWASVDKKAKVQPGYSPYKSFLNNPLSYVDPDGNTEFESITFIDQRSGKSLTITRAVSTDVFVSANRKDWDGTGIVLHELTWSDKITNTVFIIDKNGKWSSEVTTSFGNERTKTFYNNSQGWANFKVANNEWDKNLEGEGGTQKGGWALTSSAEGASPTKMKSLSRAEEKNVEDLITFLGAVGSNVASMGSKVADKIKDLSQIIQDAKDVVENNEKAKSNDLFEKNKRIQEYVKCPDCKRNVEKELGYLHGIKVEEEKPKINEKKLKD